MGKMIMVMEQRSDDWFAARLGKVTASRVHDLLAQTKSGYSTSRKNYMMELMVERLTGVRQEGYTNAAMQHGIDNEPIAREEYEKRINPSCLVHEVGFIEHPKIKMFGCSPDGLVGSEGLVEIKCPNTAQHVETILHGFPPRYKAQIQSQMACTNRAWCDFVSYDPRMPEPMQLVRLRMYRNDEYIETMETEVKDFLKELDEMIVAIEATKIPV
jgi:putative phage-type endonuclease